MPPEAPADPASRAARALADAGIDEAVRRIVAMEENEARLQALEGLRKTFISEASHELNTPLTPLRIHVEALAEMEDLSPAHRAHLAVIQRNVARLARLVDGMLEASRLETGRFRLDLDDAPLAVLLRDAVEAQAEAAATAAVGLRLGPIEHLVVNADRDRVGQVLQNLLGNAIRFSPAGGRITVHARREGAQAVVCVTDAGLGLSPEQIGQLFQPFSRPHEKAGAPKGTGLGLFISKGIVEQHGGRIWAESQGPGTGSSFCFTLPLAQDSGEAAAVQPGNASRPGRSLPGAGGAVAATDPTAPAKGRGWPGRPRAARRGSGP